MSIALPGNITFSSGRPSTRDIRTMVSIINQLVQCMSVLTVTLNCIRKASASTNASIHNPSPAGLQRQHQWSPFLSTKRDALVQPSPHSLCFFLVPPHCQTNKAPILPGQLVVSVVVVVLGFVFPLPISRTRGVFSLIDIARWLVCFLMPLDQQNYHTDSVPTN